ncbi:MAG: YdeI/OmpD-associated family protein [Flavobacteriales bacterium]
MKMTKTIDVFLADGCGRCSKFGTDDCSVRRNAASIQLLRQLALEVFSEETVKWGSPCYCHNGKNIVILHSFKDNFGFTFFKGSLMSDTEGVLVQQTENMQTTRVLRYTNLSQIVAQQDLIRSYLFEALEIEKAGLKPKPKTVQQFPEPTELLQAFETDPNFEAAFRSLTPGRQRNYLRHFNEAKQSATKISRIEKYKPFIFRGIGMDEAWKMQ